MADPNLLMDRLLAAEGPLHAVLDGAQFDNLPDALLLAGLTHRPLYMDVSGQGPQFERAAPQLVALDRQRGDDGAPLPRRSALDALIGLVGERPAVVFWVCEEAGDLIFRHLRTINVARIPRQDGPPAGEGEGEDGGLVGRMDDLTDSVEPVGQPAPQEPSGQEPADGDAFEPAVFRHADANVMAQVLPSLDGLGFARLFGPAAAILFAPDADWAGRSGVMAAPRPDDLPAPPPGPLTLDAAAMKRVQARRLARSRRRIMGYLREAAPDETADMSEEELAVAAGDHMKQARSFGIETEAGMGRWSYLQLVSGGAMADDEDIRAYMGGADDGTTPDQRVQALMRSTARELAGGGH